MKENSVFWTVLGSVLFHSCLYQISKHYLVKWVCRQFLSGTVKLESDLKSETGGIETLSSSRSDLITPKKEKKKVVTDGDVATVAVE